MILGWLGSHVDLIGSITTLCGSALALVNSQLEKKHKRFAITGGVIALIGGILTLIASRSSSHSQVAFQTQVLTSQQQIIANAGIINNKMQDATTRLDTFSSKLGEEKDAVSHLTGDIKHGNQQLLDATKQVTDAVTGGSNLCFIRPAQEPLMFPAATVTQIRLYIDNQGSTNCFDIKYQVIPAILPTDSKEVGLRKYTQMVSGELSIAHGHKEQTPDAGYMTATNTVLPVGAYQALVDERNGQVSEEFSWKWQDGKLHSTIKVTRTSDQKVIFEEHFPK